MTNIFDFFADFSQKSLISSMKARTIIQNKLQHVVDVFYNDIISLNQTGDHIT